MLLYGRSVTFLPLGTFAQDICFQVIVNQSTDSDMGGTEMGHSDGVGEVGKEGWRRLHLRH